MGKAGRCCTGKTRRNHGLERNTVVIATAGVGASLRGTQFARIPQTSLERCTGPSRYPRGCARVMFGSGGRCVYCPHCKDHLSKSAYYRHRRQFFDRTKREWRLNVEADGLEASSSEDDLEDILAIRHSANEGSFPNSTLSSHEQQTLEMPGLVFKAGVPYIE